jgi:hypothetical protein
MYVAEEHSIYGSSRVGVDNRKDTLYMGAVYTPTWGGANTSRRALGLKSFELSNHLGNVLVTVSDKPIYKVSSTPIFFQPEVTYISDYYPFGAPIQGRSFSSTEYRFGYNTQEKTDEIAGPGNHNTATFWEYDGRLVLRWNQDLKFIIGVSPYAINGDNPIFYTDPKGDFRTKFGAQLYKYSHGGRGNVSKANSGIHKGEWSVSQKVHREGGAEGNENRIDEVLIVQQGRWSWWQSNKTEKTQSSGGGSNLGTGLSSFDFAAGVYSEYGHNHTTYTTTKGIEKNIYKANGQIRSARAAGFARASNLVRGVAVVGSVLSTGYSTLQVYDQWDAGGIQNVNGWDATDAGVGMFGLGATGLTYIGMISNPVGLAIGAGVLIYSGTRLAYDLYNKP